MIHLKGYVDSAEPKVTKGASERWGDLQKDWKVYADELKSIVGEEMNQYNTLYKTLELPALILPNK